MSGAFEQVFFRALDDLDAGRAEPIECYLELVPSPERQELADLLAEVLAARGPAARPTAAESASYARALAVISEISGSRGTSGILPGLLVQIRHSRGIEREEVVDGLARRFEVGDRGQRTFQRLYHKLESGQLIGSKLSRRLLAALGEIFQIDELDLEAASRPGSAARPTAPAVAFGRGSGSRGGAAPTRQESASLSPDEQLVTELFTGGRDA